MKRRTLSALAGLATTVALAVVAAPIPSAQATPAPVGPIGGVCKEAREVQSTGLEIKINVQLCGVADVDQRRSSLVQNGSVHCGPTSLYNSLHYLATLTGMPATLLSGQDITNYDPHDPADYAAASAWVGWLGHKAGINGGNAGGSTPAENRAAFDAATAGAVQAGWTVARGHVSANDGAEFGVKLAGRMAYAPVQLWFGRYTKNADGTYTRAGGHAVTVVAATGTSGQGEIQLTLHDPARDDKGQAGWLDHQSPVATEKVTLTRQTQKVTWEDKDGETQVSTRTYWRITGSGYSVDGKNHLAEGFNWFEATPPAGS